VGKWVVEQISGDNIIFVVAMAATMPRIDIIFEFISFVEIKLTTGVA
jgi:hypothetical protein